MMKQRQINRLAEGKISSFLHAEEQREVLIIQGPRQVGKTTLISKLLAEYSGVTQINLEEDFELRAAIDATTSFDDFTRLLRDRFDINPEKEPFILFIDEAQESDRLGAYVRFMKEKWRYGKVILSGSSMSRIFRREQRIPVGRFVVFQIAPFGIREFFDACERSVLVELIDDFETALSVKNISPNFKDEFLALLDQYLSLGGLPAVVIAHFQKRDSRRIRTSILLGQEDDFVRKSSLEERALFRAGLRGVANYLGMPSKNTHVHEKQHIAEKVLSVEMAWHLIHEIEQHGLNSTTRFYPKRYIYDIGMAQELREMPFPPLSLVSTKNSALRTQLGGLFENALLLQLLAEEQSLAHISGWKKSTREAVEVDFIWRVGNATIPIECKATLNATPRNFSGLHHYMKATGVRCGILISAAPFFVFKQGNLNFVNVPIYLATGKAIKRVFDEYGK